MHLVHMSGIGAVVKVVYSHPCGWGSIPSNSCSFFIVSLSKGLSLCFMCSDQHVKYWMPRRFPLTTSLLLDYHAKQYIHTPSLLMLYFPHRKTTATTFHSFITHGITQNYFFIYSSVKYVCCSVIKSFKTIGNLLQKSKAMILYLQQVQNSPSTSLQSCMLQSVFYNIIVGRTPPVHN